MRGDKGLPGPAGPPGHAGKKPSVRGACIIANQIRYLCNEFN